MATFRIDPGAGNVTTALADALEAAKRGDVIFVPTDEWHELACLAAEMMGVEGVTIRIAGIHSPEDFGPANRQFHQGEYR